MPLSFGNVLKAPTNTTDRFSTALSTAPSISFTKPASSPFSTALNNVSSGKSTPTPSTPLKSVTQNNTDGSSTVHEYHAPPKDTSSQSSAGYSQNGLLRNNTSTQPIVGTTGTPNVVGTAPQPTGYSEYLRQNQDTNKPYGNGAGTGLLGQITTGLANTAQMGSGDVRAARNDLAQYQQDVAKKNADIVGTGADLSFKQGQQGALQQLSAIGTQTREQALANALQSQSLQQTGLQQAGNLATPQLAGYNQQSFNPLTNQFSGGGSLNDAVSGVAQKLQNGQMSYADATAALSGYGQGGINALQQALPPGFNIPQSNTLASQQGSIGVNYQLAKNALSQVENTLKGLSSSPFSDIQGTNIPGVNAVGNYLATQTGLGSEQTRAVTGAVQSLRNAYASLLASSKGGTPTDYSSQAISEIPDNPTPNDIAAVRANMETLGKARAQILGNPGVAGTSNSGAASAGGYNFKQDANGNWIPA